MLKGRRKHMTYSTIIVKLDALGSTYRLVCDAWGNGYDYTCYVTLCMFYKVDYCSEVIFDNLIDLLDDRFFKLH